MSAAPGPELAPPDDPDSLGRRLAADPRALKDCYVALGPMVLAYLRRFVPRDEAEDVLQQVFLDVWRSRDRFDPSRRLEPWVLNIAHRRAVDHLRRMARSPADSSVELPADVADVDRSTARFADRFADAVLVRDTLGFLPAEQRETLVLAYFGDLTQSQIAGRMGVPLGTVKARIIPRPASSRLGPGSGGRAVSDHVQGPADLHPIDQLAPLLAGELPLAELRSVVVHVRRCPHCQAELVEVAAGYGALQGVAREGLDDLAEPPPLAVHPIDVVPVRPVEPVAGVPAPDGRASGDAGRPGRSRVASIAATVAAAVLLVIGGVLIGTRIEGEQQIATPTTTSTPPPEASVAFIRKGEVEADGTVAMAEVDGTDGTEQLMSVETSNLPPAPEGSFYEVWLLQPDTGQMLAVGVLPNTGSEDFTIPAAIVGNYQAVDVSLQPDDGGIVHSGNSILRATYA